MSSPSSSNLAGMPMIVRPVISTMPDIVSFESLLYNHANHPQQASSTAMDQILVIDDQQDLREAVALVLRENGYEVLEAEDGETGVELAHSNQPSLIICDIEMPRLNGYQTFYELQRNVSTSGIPFIFLSARANQAEVREGITLGADDYIPKPFAAEDLLRAVDTQLRKRISKDGYNLPAPYLADTLNIAPGERYDVIVDCNEPGLWAYHCHILTHAESARGMFGMVTVLVIE